jgi:hypothetical protein
MTVNNINIEASAWKINDAICVADLAQAADPLKCVFERESKLLVAFVRENSAN